MKIEFMASVGVVATDPPASRELYLDALGLPLGTSQSPTDRPIPQVSLEFEVASADAVQTAADELAAKGFSLLHPARKEPWGQTVARLLSIEGSIVGISYLPWLHN